MDVLNPRPNLPNTDDHLRELELRLPPWAGLALAAMWFIVLQHRAPDCTNSHQCANLILAAITYLGQFIVPLLLVVGSSAALALMTRRSEQNVRRRPVTDSGALARLSWLGLEELVAWYYRSQGFAVKKCGGARADGGIDLIIRKNGKEFVVQCKLRSNGCVGVKDVRELAGVVLKSKSDGGILLTAGGFSEVAVRFVEGMNLILISGQDFLEMLQRDRHCPEHNLPLDLKVAGQDTKFAGRAFFGCPRRDCGYKLPTT